LGTTFSRVWDDYRKNCARDIYISHVYFSHHIGASVIGPHSEHWRIKLRETLKNDPPNCQIYKNDLRHIKSLVKAISDEK
jgi:hypothetical protein